MRAAKTEKRAATRATRRTGGAIRRRQITAPRRSRPRGEDAARAAHVSYGQYVAILKDAAARHLPPQEIEAKLRGAARW